MKIYSKLCYYDTRNPEGIIAFLTTEEIQEEGLTTKAKNNCYCENCFYGRTQLAEYIIKLKKELNNEKRSKSNIYSI